MEAKNIKMKRINSEVNVPISYPKPTKETLGIFEKTEEKKAAITTRILDPRIILLGKTNLPSFIRAISHKKKATVTVVEISTLLLTSDEILNIGRKNTGARKTNSNIKKDEARSKPTVLFTGSLLVFFIEIMGN